jgi:ureidoacrylate peracid hydrolase
MSSLDFTYKNIDKYINRSNMIVDKIDPKKSLLLVLDMQHACVTRGGAMYIPSIGGAPEGADVVQPVLNVLNACRKVGIPVVWSMWGLREDGKDAGYADKKWGVDLMNFPGSWGHGGDELDSNLVPLPGEPIMKKHRFSSFYGTALNEYMKRAGADTLIIAGVSTANCMLTTAIDGANPRQIFRKITLTLLLQILSPLLIDSFAFNFNNFNLIYLLTGGGPRNELDGEIAGATDILISYTYKIAFNEGSSNLGLASAISVLIFLLVASISLYGLKKSKVMEDLK